MWLPARGSGTEEHQLSGQMDLRIATPAGRVEKNADLNGVYQAFTTANWDLLTHAAEAGPVPSLAAWFAMPAGLGIVEGNEIPYQPWALKKKQENFAQRLKADRDDSAVGDNELKCFMPGVPRATYMPYPFQILQGSSNTSWSRTSSRMRVA